MSLRCLFDGSAWLTPDEVRERRHAAFTKLGKVNEGLQQWDAYDRAEADPSAPRVQRPTLSRAGLRCLRILLRVHLRELGVLRCVEGPAGRVI